MSAEAIPEEHKGRLAALQQARTLLTEHFDVGFIVVSHMEEAQTRFARTEWGNKFALSSLAENYSDGELEPMLDEPEEEDDDEDNEAWKLKG